MPFRASSSELQKTMLIISNIWLYLKLKFFDFDQSVYCWTISWNSKVPSIAASLFSIVDLAGY